MRLGSTRPLVHADCFALLPSDATLANSTLLAENLAKVKAVGKGELSVFRALHMTFGAYFWRTGILKLINDCANFTLPWLLYHLTDRLSEEEVAALAESLGLAKGESLFVVLALSCLLLSSCAGLMQPNRKITSTVLVMLDFVDCPSR